MADIGGNRTAIFQAKASSGKNAIGEAIQTWNVVCSHLGWIDMQSGDSKRSTYLAKVEESTHVFLCDFKSEVYALKGKDIQMMCMGEVYDVLYMDNPMEMDEQLEIYLRKVGS